MGLNLQTEKTNGGPKATCLSSDFFDALSKVAPCVPSQGMEERLSKVPSEAAAAYPTFLQNLRCRTRNGMGLRKHLRDKTRQEERGRKIPRILVFVLQGPGSKEVTSV